MLLYVNSSIAIILMGKRELIALLNLSSWCLVMVERLFLAVPRGCLQFVIVVFPDHTHLLFFNRESIKQYSQSCSVTYSATLPSLFKLWPLFLYSFFYSKYKKILSETTWPNAIVLGLPQ